MHNLKCQLYAVATDSDVIFTQQNNTVLIDSEQSNLEKVSFLSSIKVHINRVSGLGLKPNLNTKYAGTLTLIVKIKSKKYHFQWVAVLKMGKQRLFIARMHNWISTFLYAS